MLILGFRIRGFVPQDKSHLTTYAWALLRTNSFTVGNANELSWIVLGTLSTTTQISDNTMH